MQERTNEIILENFSFSVGRLVIKQTTTQTEISMPDTALKAIGQVVSAPQQLLGIESNGTLIQPPTPAIVTQPTATTKPRRRRRTSTGENGQGTAGGASADSVVGHILELKQEAFFKQERDTAQVVDKLHQRGHTTAKPSNVSMALLQLTREKDLAKKLYRQKDAHKKWTYRDTPYEHD
jgi:hypothetical protein